MIGFHAFTTIPHPPSVYAFLHMSPPVARSLPSTSVLSATSSEMQGPQITPGHTQPIFTSYLMLRTENVIFLISCSIGSHQYIMKVLRGNILLNLVIFSVLSFYWEGSIPGSSQGLHLTLEGLILTVLRGLLGKPRIKSKFVAYKEKSLQL